MADEAHMPVAERGTRKRKANTKKGSKGKKKLKGMPDRSGEKMKINNKMRKLFRKRARDYNSDDEDEEEDGEESTPEFRGDVSRSVKKNMGKEEGGDSSDAEGEEGEGFSDDDEENGEIQPGIADFAEGSRVFKMAFKSILKSSVADDALGPVLSAHKKLVVEKLAEEEAERKVKGEAKKEKHLLAEKGHVKPANYLDSHEKFLIGVATKGVVKLFNAVNKAQNAQKGLNPSRSKDAKVLNKRRKETFFSELGKVSVSTDASSKGDAPAWAPLRDNYMLTNSKLKDWDKLPDSTVADETGRLSEEDGSSDDD